MVDPRVEHLAEVLVHYSTEVKEKEVVLIGGSTLAAPLIREIYKKVLQVGAYPRLRLSLPEMGKVFYDLARDHQLSYLSPIDLYEAEHTDVFINIQSEANTKTLTSVAPEKQAVTTRTRKPLRDIILKKDRWVLTLFPTEAYAQDAEMSLEEFEDFVYRATFADREDPIAAWRELSARQQRLVDFLNQAHTIRIVGPDTELSMSVEGRKFINSDGHYNMPSGEVFTGPVENSVEGYIRFSFPVCREGKEVEDVRLEFREGRVVRATARKNESYLHRMLEVDEGARYVGELGMGTNWGIDRFIKNILFDEKIGGTIHLALGNSYPETGGVNQSALHWDMIRDLREEGEIYVDGRLFYKNREFIGFS